MSGQRGSWWDHCDRVAQVRQMWADGLSAWQIAQHFQWQVSRSAVMGKVRRLGLPFRKDFHGPRKLGPVGRPPRSGAKIEIFGQRVRPRNIPRRVALPLPVLAATAANPKTLLELERHHCRWPIHADDAPALFCAADKWANQAHCADHCRMAWAPARRRAA